MKPQESQLSFADIDRGVRTIEHLTEYIGELKREAAELNQSSVAIDRGYFSASEDDQITGLLVSYCQCRGALLDLVEEFRCFDGLREPSDRHAAYLLTFAAALTLIDVARFLREHAEDRPLVRRKLNQPLPTFGIEGGTYDRTQKSLVSARHAWHLYHALKYESKYREELVDVARQRNLESILSIVDELRARSDISLRRFARVKLRTRGDQILRRIGRTLFQRSSYGIQKIVSSLMADKYVRVGHQPQIPQGIIESLEEVIQPGDVFVVRKEHALTNYFLPGFWPHAALYLGSVIDFQSMGIENHPLVLQRWQQLTETSSRCVLESMKDGVRIRCWSSPLASDSCLILRPQLTAGKIAEGLARVLAHEGKRYDFDFNFERSDRMVCTEVVYRAYDGLDGMSLPLTTRAGRPSLSGGDLVQMAIDGKYFDAVAVYVPSLGDSLVTGNEVSDIVKCVATA